MAKNENRVIKLDGFQVYMKPLKRKAIYGERVVVPLDSENFECRNAFIDEDSIGIYPNQAVSICKINEEGKMYVPEKTSYRHGREIISSGSYSSIRSNSYSDSFACDNKLVNRSAEIDFGYFLNLDRLIYTLEGLDQMALAEHLGNEMYTFDFIPIHDAPAQNAYVFARGQNIFLIIGKGSYFSPEPISLDDRGNQSGENLDFDFDDIDFDMF